MGNRKNNSKELEYRKAGTMEYWKDEKTLINPVIYGINADMERRNINRGFKRLRVWQDSVKLYALAWKLFSGFPFELRKVASNALDAAHSISRNISEGYCRRSLKEYLNHLNVALGSCGEFHSCYESFKQADQITQEQYEELDERHFKVENELLKLIKSLQKKQDTGGWEDSFSKME
jgi:four helix bundle protein